MEKPDKLQNKTYTPLKLLPVDKSKVNGYTLEDNTVSIICNVDARVFITGTVTGKIYVFERAGAILKVDKLDANDILNKKQEKACCGGIQGGAPFQLV